MRGIRPSLQENTVKQPDSAPASALQFPRFLVGRDRRGNWVVQDREHRCGGLFVNPKEALKFAMFENGNQPQAVIMVPGFLELDMDERAGASAKSAVATEPPRRHVA